MYMHTSVPMVISKPDKNPATKTQHIGIPKFDGKTTTTTGISRKKKVSLKRHAIIMENPTNSVTHSHLQNGKSSSSTLVQVKYPNPPPSLPTSNSRQLLVKGLTISLANALISSIFFSNLLSVSR